MRHLVLEHVTFRSRGKPGAERFLQSLPQLAVKLETFTWVVESETMLFDEEMRGDIRTALESFQDLHIRGLSSEQQADFRSAGIAPHAHLD